MSVIYKPNEWNYLRLEFKDNINKTKIKNEIKKEQEVNKENTLKKSNYKTTYEPLNDVDVLNMRIKNNLTKNKDLNKKKHNHCIIL